MSQQRDEQQKLPDGYSKIDRGYQNSKSYLLDQLQYSNSVQEFRTIKQAILRSVQFSVSARSFQFARVAVEVESQQPQRKS